MTSPALSDVLDALDRVYDPCSISSNTPIGIHDMGLVRDCSIEGHRVSVQICVTGPSCMLVGSIVKGIEEQLGELDGVEAVEVSVDADYVWTPDDISSRGREQMETVRRKSVERVPVRPQQWRTSPALADVRRARPGRQRNVASPV